MSSIPNPIASTIRQNTGFDVAGKPVVSYAVQFSVGAHGPFTHVFTESDFTTQNVLAYMRDFAAKLNEIAPPAGA